MKQTLGKIREKLGPLLWIVLAVLLMILNLGVNTAHAEGLTPAENVQITSCAINGEH